MIKYLELKSLYSVKSSILLVLLMSMIVSPLFIPFTARADTSSTIPLCEITRNLKIGDSGEDVKCLQKYLNWAGFTVATTGVGSPGNETTYFGSRTRDAVVKWQNANSTNVLAPANLSVGTGFWGPLSFNWYVSLVRVQLGLPA